MAKKSSFATFIAELRRRRVFRVAAFYGGIAFVIVQIIDGTFELLAIPQFVGRLLVILLVAGFPVALIIAWIIKPVHDSKRRSDPWRIARASGLISRTGFL